MNPLDILLRWLAPILDPLKTFRSQTAALNTIHHTSVQTMENLVAALTTPAPDAFTGEAARAFSSATMEYVHTEKMLSGTGTNVGGANLAGPLLAAAVACEQAEAGVGQAAAVAAVGVTDDQLLFEATAAIDVTTAAQGGLDVPEDVVAVGATGITLATILQILADLALVIGGILWVWQSTMHAIGQLLPKLPPTPTPQTIPFQTNPPVNQQSRKLTAKEEELAQELSQEPGIGVSLDDIREIIRENPGLRKDQYRLLIEAYKQTGFIPFGVVAVGTRDDGTVVYLTQDGLDKIRRVHGSDFQGLSDQQLKDLLMNTLKEDPYDLTGDRNLYKNVVINKKRVDLIIVVSSAPDYEGMIISSYIPSKKR